MNSKLYSAIGKSVTGRLLVFLIQFLMMIIYARIFSPEEFGVIASISVFVVFFQMLSDMGIGPGIISLKKISIEQRNGIFTFTIILGLVLGVLFYFFSFALTIFYDNYDYSQISILLSISVFFNAAVILPATSMNKDAIFLKVALMTMAVEVVVLFIIFYLYKSGFGVLALASRPMFVSIFRFIILWFFSKKTTLGRAFLGRGLSEIKIIYKFAMYQFGFNFVNYFSRNLDNILVGKFFGMSQLGLYDKSYNLMRYPLVLTSFAMSPAIQPVLTKYKDNKEFILKNHIDLAVKLAVVSFLISAFIFLNSKEIVMTLLGADWGGVVPLVNILALSIPVQAVSSCSGSFYQVLGNTKAMFLSGNITAAVNSIGIVIGIYFGDILALSVAIVITFHISFFINNFILARFLYKKSMNDFYLAIFRSICTISAPIFVYVLLKHLILESFFIGNSSLNLLMNLLMNLLIAIGVLVVFKNMVVESLTRNEVSDYQV